MWFAFKNVSLSYWKQQCFRSVFCHKGCDLLSKMYLCRIGNNLSLLYGSHSRVVICFQKCIFVVLETTPDSIRSAVVKLWFAFKNVSLSYWKQPFLIYIYIKIGCDLLSKMYLCRIGNNLKDFYYKWKNVVICFQKCIFVVLETTSLFIGMSDKELWFAFKNVSLSYWKQHLVLELATTKGCDLLSKMYLCRIGNNISGIIRWIMRLWFAFKNVSLSYWKQQR